jgi:hypothetical protein
MATKEIKPSDPMIDPATGEYRVIGQGQTFLSITEKIARIVLTPHTPMGWFALFTVAGGVAMVLLTAVTWLFLKGVGIWAISQPVDWGFAIINFVWWIGIGHAGTLISAILLLFKQGWRNAISRFAEAMTIFAVCCAGLFPLIHVGRPWLGYWLLPLPFTMTVWPQFRSPLLWDVFAVSTYATISVVFWYIGMVPDLGTLLEVEDRAIFLWHRQRGLARIGAPLDALRDGLAAAGRFGHAAGALGAHGHQLRFRRGCAARLAHDHLPALFRGRRHLLRIRDGSHAGHSAAQVLSP